MRNKRSIARKKVSQIIWFKIIRKGEIKMSMNSVSVAKDPIGLLWSIIFFPAIAIAILVIAPTVVGEMVTKQGIALDQAGYIISGELAGMALATLPAYYWLRRVSTRRALYVAIIASSLLSITAFFHTVSGMEYQTILVLRFLAGIANGTIMMICFTTMGGMNNPDRAFGLHTLGQLTLSAVGLAVLPLLFAKTGLQALYLMMAVAILLVIPMVKNFPELNKLTPQDIRPKSIEGNVLLEVLGLFGIFLFYVSLSGVWTYAERIGVNAGIDQIAVGFVLSIATFFGIASAALSSFMGGRVNNLIPIIIGMLMLTLAVWLFSTELTYTTYFITAAIFKFGWTFVLTFLLGLLAKIDVSGRLVMSTFMIIGIGLAIGPALVAKFIGTEGNYQKGVLFCLSVIIACTIIMTFVAMVERKGAKA